MNWRVKTLLGVVLIVLGLLIALFEAGLLIFADCAIACPEGRQRAFVVILVLAGFALATGGVIMVRRAMRDRVWQR